MILVVDDHELFATTLCMALRGSGFDARRAVIGTMGSILAQAEALPTGSPAGLVVLDLHLGRDPAGGRIDPVALTSALRGLGWVVLVVSGSRDERTEAAVIAAGAAGSVPKSCAFEQLVDTVRAAAAGRPVMTDLERHQWLVRHRRHRAEIRQLARRYERLSSRERQVLELLTQGMRAAEITAHFTVSLTTVRTQIRAILAKLEVSSQLEAVALADAWYSLDGECPPPS